MCRGNMEQPGLIEALEEARLIFMEGFNAGISAGHDLAPMRERDAELQWKESDAFDAVKAKFHKAE